MASRPTPRPVKPSADSDWETVSTPRARSASADGWEVVSGPGKQGAPGDWTGTAETLGKPTARQTALGVAGKGAGALLGSLDNTALGRWINRATLGQKEADRENAAFQNWIAPHTSGQQTAAEIGQAIGNMLPYAAADAVSGFLGEIPEGIAELPAAVRLLSRTGISALMQGAANKALGGSFGTGAAFGAGAEGVSAAARAIAPALAEHALRLQHGLGYGKELLLERPGGLTAQGFMRRAARRAAQRTSDELLPMLNAAGERGARVPLGPARDVLGGAHAAELSRNSPAIGPVGDLSNQLQFQRGPEGGFTDEPLPATVTPRSAFDLKQGLRNARPDVFGQEKTGVAETVNRAIRKGSHALDAATDAVVPGHAEVNKRIGALLEASRANPKFLPFLKHSLVFGGPGLAMYYAGMPLGLDEKQRLGLALGTGLLSEFAANPSSQLLAARALWRLGRNGADASLIGREPFFHPPEPEAPTVVTPPPRGLPPGQYDIGPGTPPTETGPKLLPGFSFERTGGKPVQTPVRPVRPVRGLLLAENPPGNIVPPSGVITRSPLDFTNIAPPPRPGERIRSQNDLRALFARPKLDLPQEFPLIEPREKIVPAPRGGSEPEASNTQLITNASGESEASQEAINRQRRQAAKGQKIVKVDTRYSRPEDVRLTGPEAWDRAHNPGPWEATYIVHPDGHRELIAAGARAKVR